MTTHQVLLVPGFFGFGKFGEISYFNGVSEALLRNFEALGIDATITEVATLPTASIRTRAARVLEALATVAELSSGPIHIIGHSTGGLDARLAIAPTASLPTSVKFADYGRIKTLVTVSCPHFGTPLATFFSSAMGKPLLRMCARYFIWILRRKHIPLRLLLRMGYWGVRLRNPFAKRKGTFHQLYEKLLNDFSEQRRLELIQFLENVSTDQSLLFQLTPAGCDLLNACTADPGVRYGSVVTRATPPTFRSLLRSVVDLYTQMMHPLYACAHWITSRAESKLLPPPAPEQATVLVTRFGRVPTPADNDGIVPTNSQLWGELIHAANADHLDVVGQYGRVASEDYVGDWIPSYSLFEDQAFDALWVDVANFIAEQTKGIGLESGTNVGTERTEQDLPLDNH